jgi:hypothetical protein
MKRAEYVRQQRRHHQQGTEEQIGRVVLPKQQVVP